MNLLLTGHVQPKLVAPPLLCQHMRPHALSLSDQCFGHTHGMSCEKRSKSISHESLEGQLSAHYSSNTHMHPLLETSWCTEKIEHLVCNRFNSELFSCGCIEVVAMPFSVPTKWNQLLQPQFVFVLCICVVTSSLGVNLEVWSGTALGDNFSCLGPALGPKPFKKHGLNTRGPLSGGASVIGLQRLER